MTFSAHTFETNPSEGNLGFAFRENIGEGQEVFFLGKFNEDDVDPKTIAEAVFGAIIESFTSSKITDPYDRFEDALKAANLEAQKRKKNWKQIPNIVISFFDFNNLYLSQSGECEAYLIRGTSVSQITETPENGDTLFSNILSGQVAIDDVVILSSSRLLRSITANQIVDTLSRSDFGEAVGLLRHELQTASEEDTLVTAVGIGKKEESQSAGFLSKVVSKGKKALKPDDKSVPIETKPEPIEEDFDEDDFEEESFGDVPAEEKAPLKVGDLLNKCKSLCSKLPFKTKKLKPQKNLMIIAGTILLILIVGIGIKSIANYESTDTKALREQLSIAREYRVVADTLLL